MACAYFVKHKAVDSAFNNHDAKFSALLAQRLQQLPRIDSTFIFQSCRRMRTLLSIRRPAQFSLAHRANNDVVELHERISCLELVATQQSYLSTLRAAKKLQLWHTMKLFLYYHCIFQLVSIVSACFCVVAKNK